MSLDHNALRAMVAVVQSGSFDAAAASLSVTPSAISQRIKHLEERMGMVLLRRATPCEPTTAGLRLYRHASEVALLDAEVMRDLAPDRPNDDPVQIRIAANADSLATWLLGGLSQISNMTFDVVVDDQDYSAEWLRRGEVVAAVTAHKTPVQGCDSLPLGAFRYRATASPAFIDRWFAQGVTKETIRAAPALVYSAKDRLQENWILANFGRVRPALFHQLPSTQAFIEAAERGMGWGMNPEPLVADAMARGKLVELVADTGFDVPLYWQFSRRLGAALGPVTSQLRRAAKTALVQC